MSHCMLPAWRINFFINVAGVITACYDGVDLLSRHIVSPFDQRTLP